MAMIKHTNKIHKEMSLDHLKDTSISVAHDFKEFLTRSHAVDLASALVMGASVTAIIHSMVDDILMPCISAVFGANIRSLVLKVGPAHIAYGAFIQAVFNFLLIAWVVFLFLRTTSKVRKGLDEFDPKTKK